MLILGTDGTKMSKSKGNTIDIFLPEKALKTVVNSIVTDSTPLESPKDPSTCNAFTIYSYLADKSDVEKLNEKYRAGGWGYGHTKKAILELILDKFSQQRERFDYLMSHTDHLEETLGKGAEKAKIVASNVLGRVRNRLGYGS